jgi:hypothetical protein
MMGMDDELTDVAGVERVCSQVLAAHALEHGVEHIERAAAGGHEDRRTQGEAQKDGDDGHD